MSSIKVEGSGSIACFASEEAESTWPWTSASIACVSSSVATRFSIR
jgi:hypothetical protein